MTSNKLLLQIENLIEGAVVKRPSQFIKTPYVADILPTQINTSVIAHTASLGCCGLVDKDAKILMAPISKPKTKIKPKINPKTNLEKQSCSFRVYLAILQERNTEIIVGVHPTLAEQLTESALQKNYLSTLQNVKSYQRETTIHVKNKINSRFDFTGIDKNGIPFIMEIKNVPLADYEDIVAKERKTKCYDSCDIDAKVAYFPDGYRKKSTEPISPRALKHIRELTIIKRETKIRCIMCYVIQRTDVNRFQPSIIDETYRSAVKEGIESGVEIITMVVEWTRDGNAYFVKDNLPITEF
jgi:DNA-binding sugar fermentation-stimulating protein